MKCKKTFPRSSFRPILRPAVENAWHGGPPAIANSSLGRIPKSKHKLSALSCRMSDSYTRRSGQFFRMVRQATGSTSLTAKHLNPAASNPMSRPQAPEKNDINSCLERWAVFCRVRAEGAFPVIISVERILKSRLPGGLFSNVTPLRSQIMSAIRSRGNKSTEMVLRMALVRAKMGGWIMHPKGVPGKPDFFFAANNLAVFVDGCFWHGCNRCGHIPKTNRPYWKAKIARNRLQHRKVAKQLRAQGTTIVRFWEHQLSQDVNRCILKIASLLGP